jgi:hypothetical protein
LAEFVLQAKTLMLGRNFAAEMSSRKLFFRQSALLSPINLLDQSVSIHIALA